MAKREGKADSKLEWIKTKIDTCLSTTTWTISLLSLNHCSLLNLDHCSHDHHRSYQQHHGWWCNN
ncbi:hypothetical protein E2C01_030641 [Portunus trituberculatus]|uniref:Uncharacterized protein n=1 Tax=Portunus trituberculatus TaxID=210409 RepID=A0A5B7EVD6_PORTR|nr:hypothetical protein [Portunus trituberculatus]